MSSELPFLLFAVSGFCTRNAPPQAPALGSPLQTGQPFSVGVTLPLPHSQWSFLFFLHKSKSQVPLPCSQPHAGPPPPLSPSTSLTCLEAHFSLSSSLEPQECSLAIPSGLTATPFLSAINKPAHYHPWPGQGTPPAQPPGSVYKGIISTRRDHSVIQVILK